MSDVSDEARDLFERALDAASAAFRATIDEHFRRTYDGSSEDRERVTAEYREAVRELRHEGRALYLRSGLVDADFTCHLSPHADENFAEDADL